MENERNLKETLFHINFQLRRSQEMYSKASKYRKFQSRAILHTRINYSLVQAIKRASFDFCERLLQSIIHSTALPILLKIPSKLEAITNITILFSEVFRNRIKSVFKSVMCIQNAFGSGC